MTGEDAESDSNADNDMPHEVNEASSVPTELADAYLAKIAEWGDLGYDTEGMEDLLFSDFEAFKKIEEDILSGNLKPGSSPVKVKEENNDLVLLGEATGKTEVTTKPKSRRLPEEKKTDEDEILLIDTIPDDKTTSTESKHEAVIIVKPKPGARKKKKAVSKAKRQPRLKKVKKPVKGKKKKAAAPKRKSSSHFSSRGPQYTAYAVFMVALIVGAVYIVKPDIFQDITHLSTPLKAKMYVTEGASSGQALLFDASNSTGDITSYHWSFGDGTTSDSKKVYHSYSKPGTYMVTLRIGDGSSQEYTEKYVSISPLIVHIPETMIGDTGRYHINGYLNISNPSGITSFPNPMGEGDITLNSINVDYSDRDGRPAKNSVLAETTKSDGFGTEHNVLFTEMEQYIDLNIKLTTSNGVLSTTGTASSTEQAYTDLKTKDTIHTYTITDTNIKNFLGSDPLFTSHSNVRSYPILNRQSTEISLDRVRPNRTFYQGETDIGGSELGLPYGLIVGDAEDINGYPSLKITVRFDPEQISQMGLDTLDMYIWVSNRSSMPVKTYIRGEGESNGNSTEFEYVQEMFYFNSGSKAVNWGACSASGTGDSHYLASNPDAELMPWDPLWRGPEVGTRQSQSSVYYTLEDAYYDAIKDQGLSDFLGGNSNAYLVDANVTSTTGVQTWSLTWASMGAASGYHVLVNESGAILDSGSIQVDPATYPLEQFNLSTSFTSAEYIFSQIPELAPAFPSGSFKIDQGVLSMAAATDSDTTASSLEKAVPSSTLGLLLSLSTPRYSYNLRYTDEKTYTATIDAETGQIVSVSDYTVTNHINL